MICGVIENSNLKLLGNGDDVYDIFARMELEGNYRAVTTAWIPTPAEMIRLNAGEPVYVTQLILEGDGFQPIRVEVKP